MIRKIIIVVLTVATVGVTVPWVHTICFGSDDSDVETLVMLPGLIGVVFVDDWPPRVDPLFGLICVQRFGSDDRLRFDKWEIPVYWSWFE